MFVEHYTRDERGSAAVEFAFVAPLLFTLVFGTFQLGWAYHCAGSVQFALERASRTLMVDASADEEDVSDLMRDFLDQAAGVDFEVELEQISINGNEFTRATTLYQHAVVIPFVPAFELSFTAVQVVPRPTT